MILVTGASGFIGKPLIKKLVEIYGKNEILALTSKPIENCPYLIHHNYQFKANYFIESGFENIETIIHLGAFIPKSSDEINNFQLNNQNIYNTTHLLESNLPLLKECIYISTIDVYSNESLINEETAINPVGMYGWSKYYSEKIVEKWCENQGVSAKILRIGHVFGPGEEKYQKIIPLTFQKLIKSEPIYIYGEGKAKRSFIYIDDVVDFIIGSVETELDFGVLNIAGEKPISIISLIEKIIEISGLKPELKYKDAGSADRDYIFDNRKLNEILGSPKISLEKGLEEEWRYFVEKK